jgi:hypothetical protein
MTTPRDFDRLMEAFFEDGPALLPDRVVESIRDDVDRIDVRADAGSWRNPFMLRSMFAAAVVVAVLLGGFAIYSAINQPPDVGPPTDSTAPVPSDDGLSELPPELQFSWVGPPRAVTGQSGNDRGDLSWENALWRYEMRLGVDFWSSPSVTADGDLRLSTGADGLCAFDDEGTYSWSLSPGGTILTIDAGTDDCAVRAEAIPGTYQRAACRDAGGFCLGELEAREYVSHAFEPRPLGEWQVRHGAMTYSVPEGWANYADTPDVYGLTPMSEYASYDDAAPDCYDCPGDRDLITVLGQPGAATEDCLETNVPGIGFDRRALLDWLLGHPGLQVTPPDNSTIGGFPASSFFIEASEDWTGTCDEDDPFPAVPIFYRQDSYHWALNVGARYHITLVDLGDGDTVAIVVDTADDADLEAFVETARPIIESFEFPPH